MAQYRRTGSFRTRGYRVRRHSVRCPTSGPYDPAPSALRQRSSTSRSCRRCREYHSGNALTESSCRLRRDPARRGSRDVVTCRDAGRNVVIEVPKAILGVLILAHPGRNSLTVRVGRLDNAAAPAFEISAVAAVEPAQDLRAEPHAVVGRTECDDVASLRMRESQVDSGFGRLGT